MSRHLSPRRFLIALLLACALLGAQLALAGHGIEHALHAPDEVCVECLVLPGMQAAPAQRQTLHALPLLGRAIHHAVPPAPTFLQLPAFRSRAPPLLPSD